MATYKEIFGKQIKVLASDPTNESEGQIWYNTTLNNFRTTLVSEAWSSSAPMVTGRRYLAGFGTPTTAVAAGGYTGSPTGVVEEYNGSGWATVTAMGTARYSNSGCGTLTAGLISGGGPGTPLGVLTEEYDGTNWTASGALTTGRQEASAFGIQTAAVMTGGFPPPSGTAVTEEYNGAVWAQNPSPSGDLNTARRSLPSGGAGTLAAGIIYGGGSPAKKDTETYDGSTWTAGADLITARSLGFSALQGTQTAALTGAGYPSILTVEGYDGTAWSTRPSLATSHDAASGVGTQTTAMCFGGGPGYLTGTEEFNRSANVTTPSAWAAGSAINTARTYGGGSGPLTSAMLIGGFNGPGLGGFMNSAETYNGTAWTSITNYPYSAVGMLGLGTAAAFVGGAGYNSSAAHVTTTNEWSGSWTAANAMNQAGQGGSATGTQTAGIAGNRSTAPGAQSEEYDGTNWTTTAATNTAGSGGGGMAGTQTAALIYSGAPKSRTESWNGTSWTVANDLNTARAHGSMGGSQITAFFGGGTLAPPTSNTTATEIYDGTSWRTDANMAAASFYQRGGTSTASTTQVAFAGSPTGTPSPLPGATEEWTEGTTAVNYKTITTS